MASDKDRPLVGQAALVTGGARRLGRAISLALARAGADVVVHCHRSVAEAGALVRELRGLGRGAWVERAALDDAAQAEELFAAASRSAGGRLDILVNNASIFPKGRLGELDPADLDRNIRVNAFVPFVLGRALARERRGGCVVNMLDSRIMDYDAEHAAYHISKRVLATMTRMMALEFAPRVRVNAVAPGLVLPPPGEDDAYLKRFKRTNPLERHGSAEEVAEAVLFLARSGFITGQTVFVDGGRHMKGAVYG
ncbi:MAG: SDR family oxidoreductase [Elusimicrobia bacterium]|nr:SDR family oxidoreductase [Elusimicrobiota bacterium]